MATKRHPYDVKEVFKTIRDVNGAPISDVLSCGHTVPRYRGGSSPGERYCPTCNPERFRRKRGVTSVVDRHSATYDVYIGRGSPFGNPFQQGSREVNIANYRSWFEVEIVENRDFRSKVLALKGKVLGCSCKPKPCHGDVIVEWIEDHTRTAYEEAP